MKLKTKDKQVSKTPHDKARQSKVNKKAYLDLLEEAEKWPLTYRIAAEVYRSGVNLDEFEAMHMEQNGISKRVYEYFMQCHLGRGYDPLRITPVRPVFLRYVSPTEEKRKALDAPTGRPSREDALAFVKKLIKRQVEAGWRELDFIQALRDWDDINEPEQPIKVIKLEDDDEKPATAKKERVVNRFTVKIRGAWAEFKTMKAAEEACQRIDDLEKLMPVLTPTTHCWCCKFPLRGTCVSIVENDEQRNVHVGCYFLNMVHPSHLSPGMKVLEAATGVYYTWVPADKNGKGGWLPNKQQDRNEPTQPTPDDNSGLPSEGVPAPTGQESEPPAALPVAEPAGVEVPTVPVEGRKKRPVHRASGKTQHNNKGAKAKKAQPKKPLPKRQKLQTGGGVDPKGSAAGKVA